MMRPMHPVQTEAGSGAVRGPYARYLRQRRKLSRRPSYRTKQCKPNQARECGLKWMHRILRLYGWLYLNVYLYQYLPKQLQQHKYLTFLHQKKSFEPCMLLAAPRTASLCLQNQTAVCHPSNASLRHADDSKQHPYQLQSQYAVLHFHYNE